MYAAEKTSEKVQKQRVDYWQKIRDIRVEDLIFVDESGVNLARVRYYARALKGQRARGEKPQKRGRNISLIRQFKSEVQHHLTAPRIPHEEFGSLMIFWVDD
jgi:hypothetical protein